LILQYSLIGTELEDGTPGLSHAASHQTDGTLCGLSLDDFDVLKLSSLAHADGAVDCEACMAELRKLDLVGKYAGPLPFVTEPKVVDGIQLEDFGWGVFDETFEPFFAYGHHEPGVVLELAQKLVKNNLIGWEEHRTTIYAHWRSYSPGKYDPPFCYRVWCKTGTPDDDQTLRVDRHDATVIRYEAWPLLGMEDRQAEYYCRWIKAWFEGTTKLGRAANPADMDSKDTPGFVVYGKPFGGTVARCLEWPVPRLEFALKRMNDWHSAGARELSILNHGISLPMEMLTPEVVSRIQRGRSVYSSD
jgi:hypothetical protein